MRIIICDDEEAVRNQLAQFCEKFFAEMEQGDCRIEQCSSGEACVQMLLQEGADILLLDIEMDGMDGITVKNQLNVANGNTRILFVSSHTDFMPNAYGRNVMGFISKPLSYVTFSNVMRALIEDIIQEKRYIVVTQIDRCEKIFIRDIIYIKAAQKDVDIYTTHGRIVSLSRKGIYQWANELDAEAFIQPHKSYLVNLAHVKKIDQDVLMDDGSRIKLSRDRKQEVTRAYWTYMEKHAR